MCQGFKHSCKAGMKHRQNESEQKNARLVVGMAVRRADSLSGPGGVAGPHADRRELAAQILCLRRLAGRRVEAVRVNARKVYVGMSTYMMSEYVKARDANAMREIFRCDDGQGGRVVRFNGRRGWSGCIMAAKELFTVMVVKGSRRVTWGKKYCYRTQQPNMLVNHA